MVGDKIRKPKHHPTGPRRSMAGADGDTLQLLCIASIERFCTHVCGSDGEHLQHRQYGIVPAGAI